MAREREHRRSALLNVILAGPDDDMLQGPAQLHAAHLVVVTQTADELWLEQLENIGLELEKKADASLWTVRHQSVVVVVPLSDRGDRSHIIHRLNGLVTRQGTSAIGIGGNARGADETRQSYREAVEAVRVGRLLGEPAPSVHDYQELASLIALLQEAAKADRFVTTALEPLSELRERPWVLPTVEAYLAHQGRIKEVALQLGVHVNTVKYRVREIRDVAGSLPLDGDRAIALLLALRIKRVLAFESLGARPAGPG